MQLVACFRQDRKKHTSFQKTSGSCAAFGKRRSKRQPGVLRPLVHLPNSATQVADSSEYHAAAMLGIGLGWGVPLHAFP